MRKFYTEPELEIRKYALSGNKIMTLSPPDPDLNTGDNGGSLGHNGAATPGLFGDAD